MTVSQVWVPVKKETTKKISAVRPQCGLETETSPVVLSAFADYQSHPLQINNSWSLLFHLGPVSDHTKGIRLCKLPFGLQIQHMWPKTGVSLYSWCPCHVHPYHGHIYKCTCTLTNVHTYTQSPHTYTLNTQTSNTHRRSTYTTYKHSTHAQYALSRCTRLI